MSIALYIHIGYLVAWDDYGWAIGWGVPKQPRRRGESPYRVYRERRFPWWSQPARIKQALWMASLRRKQQKADRRNG